MRPRIALAIFACVMCAAIAAAPSVDDPGRGRDAFEKRCTGCDALDKIKEGPPLRGVYARKAGTDPQFAYSDAMKSASVSWDDSTLDRWLADTESVIPGNDMTFRLNDPVERANIIAYLRQLSSAAKPTR